jgi:hypothetical protein
MWKKRSVQHSTMSSSPAMIPLLTSLVLAAQAPENEETEKNSMLSFEGIIDKKQRCSKTQRVDNTTN